MIIHRMRTIAMACTIAVFLTGSQAVPLHAQVVGQGDWGNLRQLQPGQMIRVVLANAQSHKGKFSSLSDQAMSLKDEGTELVFHRADVVRVSVLDNGKRKRSTLIGLGIGAGAGLAAGIGMFTAFGSTGSPDHAAAGLGAMGAGVGAGAGATLGRLSGFRTIYRAEQATNQAKALH